MGIRNYLIEGVSGTGKTSVATELEARGHHVVRGDRVLAYRGDPETGAPLADPLPAHDMPELDFLHRHHIWDVARVRSIVADRSHPATFFCGGSRNFHHFIDLFDGVFILDVDVETLKQRLAGRAADEFGGRPDELALVVRVHGTKEDLPAEATVIDSTAPLAEVVDEILSKCGLGG